MRSECVYGKTSRHSRCVCPPPPEFGENRLGNSSHGGCLIFFKCDLAVLYEIGMSTKTALTFPFRAVVDIAA